jgi:hypothetical protein
MKDYFAAKEAQTFDSNHKLSNLIHAVFTPIDMTDYEYGFVNFNEASGLIPFVN